MIRSKATNIFVHLLVWFLIWCTISVLASKGKNIDVYLVKNISILIPVIAIVYINWFWLFPNYFATKRYWQYGLLAILLTYAIFFIGEIVIIEWIDYLFPDRQKKSLGVDIYALPTSFWRIVNGSAPYSLGILSSTIFLAIRQKHQDEQETVALRLENAQNKIKYLQSQISPHFLFNSLNNVHALMLQDNQMASDYIIKLSDLLRFMIYETDKDFITLGEEIALLRRYMVLIDFRMGTLDVAKNLRIKIANNALRIPPLLIFGILENGVKHSGMGREDHFVFDMVIEEHQSVLTVIMNNSISSQKFDKKKKGFGIESMKKRLALHYPNRHTFLFQKSDSKAKTELTLNLDKV